MKNESVQSVIGKDNTEAVTVNLRIDCGAKGDGRSNDTEAFQKAARMLQQAGGGKLILPKGVYVVGRQVHTPGQYPFYQAEPIFRVQKLSRLHIEGNHSVLRLADGLRYGSFDKHTGRPFTPSSMPFIDGTYAAAIGHMLHISDSRNITIRDLELDGNIGGLIIGGAFGDTGIQLPGCGLFLHNNTSVRLERIHSHHHPLDGIMVGWYGLKETDPPQPHELVDCVFDFNGRQGFSWIGGKGLTARRCRFNHTGRAINAGKPFGSAPGAGLDIEAEESVCREGLFDACEFINNSGCGVVADSGDGGYTRFTRCLFWGVTNWSAWSAKPGLVFDGCRFYGSIVHAYGSENPTLATRWIRCRFEDRPWKQSGPYGGFLAELNGNLKNVTFESCRFTAGQRRSIWCSGEGFRLIDCVFTHRYAGLPHGDYAMLLRGGEIDGCRFAARVPASVQARWPIIVDGSRVGNRKPTVVEGPHLRWAHPNGPTGTIPANP